MAGRDVAKYLLRISLFRHRKRLMLRRLLENWESLIMHNGRAVKLWVCEDGFSSFELCDKVDREYDASKRISKD